MFVTISFAMHLVWKPPCILQTVILSASLSPPSVALSTTTLFSVSSSASLLFPHSYAHPLCWNICVGSVNSFLFMYSLSFTSALLFLSSLISQKIKFLSLIYTEYLCFLRLYACLRSLCFQSHVLVHAVISSDAFVELISFFFKRL